MLVCALMNAVLCRAPRKGVFVPILTFDFSKKNIPEYASVSSYIEKGP